MLDKKNQLTDRQEEILNFINSYREVNGFPPTIREIARQFGLSSTFGVKKHLDALVKKGYLHIESNASRGISTIHNTLQSLFAMKILKRSNPPSIAF